MKNSGGDLKVSSLLENMNLENHFSPENEEIKEYFDYLKKELLKENHELRQKFEEAIEEIQILKSSNLDEGGKDAIIAELQKKLQNEGKRGGSICSEEEIVALVTENKKFKAEKIYLDM